MYRRSSTETIMYPIGQNIPLVHLHFGIAFFEPHQFLNSETVRLASFLIISFPLYGTSFRLPTGKCISSLHARYPYRNGYLLNLISTFLDSKYTGKTSRSDDLIRVVRNSCITYFHLTTLRLRTSTFYMFYTSCQEDFSATYQSSPRKMTYHFKCKGIKKNST